MLFFLVILFAIIQSLFGVGLLVFGTPTLMLLGKSFSEALWIILPCSALISLFQVLQSLGQRLKIAPLFYRVFPIFFVLPMVISLIIVLKGFWPWDLKPILFTILAISPIFSWAIVRYRPRFFEHQQTSIVYLSLSGFLHGLSNLGGGFLAFYLGLLLHDKKLIRYHVALAYLCLALVQLSLLFLQEPSQGFGLVQKLDLNLILGCGFVYGPIALWLDPKLPKALFQKGLRVIICLYGIIGLCFVR